MSELNELKEMVAVLQEQMNERFDHIEIKMSERFDDIENKMARQDDVMAMKDTLESITVEIASALEDKLEDKREAGDVLLKSHFDLAYEEIQKQDNRLERMERSIVSGFQQTAKSLGDISDIMRAWIRKQHEVDQDIQDLQQKWKTVNEELQEIKRKLNGE
jgi:hypothetical protein